MRKRIAVAVLVAFTAVPAFAHNPPFVFRSKPAESVATAKQYEQEATRWRAEAAYHRQMSADYRRFSKSPVNPAIAAMERHCMAIVRAAEEHAAKADGLADEYRVRE